jgi:F0F1-type ATP synthase assembly protein I
MSDESGQGQHSYLRYLSLGMEIAAGLSLPILVGYWIDARLGTSPWMLLLGSITGMAVLFGIFVRLSRNQV